MFFTLVYIGPGLLLKARWHSISFIAFALTLLFIDLEPTFYAWFKEWPIYRGVHTLYGVMAAGLIAALLAHRIGPPIMNGLHRHVRSHLETFPHDTNHGHQVSWASALSGGLLGGILHLLLDAMIHEDIAILGGPGPSPLFGLTTAAVIYPLCILCGVVGAALLFMQWWRLGGER